MLSRRPTYQQLPPVPSGYPLGDYVSVIIPEATTNLITNPSAERGTTGHVASNGSSIARTYTKQAAGAAAIQITPSSNVNSGKYFPLALTSGQVYTYSVAVWAAPGVPMRITIATDAAVILNHVEFRGEGRWVRYWVSATPTATATHRLYVEKHNSASTALFYVDAEQCEAKAYPTTYCDGDMRGFVSTRNDFYWTGAPHASPSVRSAQTRAGGRLVNLKTLGFMLMSILGLGMGPVANVATPAGLMGGAYYQHSVRESRDFSLIGDMRHASPEQLDRDQTALVNALRHDLVSPSQPLVLRYQRRDYCDNPIGTELDIQCVHQGSGPGNAFDNLHQESTTLTFTQFLPLILGALESGASLGVNTSVANANFIQQRSPSGVWSAFGTGADDSIYAVKWGPDGRLYATGNFTTLNGTAINRIAAYDPITGLWSALGTGLNGEGRALAFGPDGSLYVTGSFTLAGGVANTAYIAKWNGTAWSALGTGLNATGHALAVGPDGFVYVGGDFTLAGGVANTIRIAYWNGSAWLPLSTGANGTVFALAFSPSATLYAGGNFTAFGGTGANSIASWTGSAGAALGQGFDGIVFSIAFGLDGTLYAGGLGDVGAPNIASWNYVSWSTLAAGVGVSGSQVSSMTVDSNGILYVVGAFTTAGGITVDRYARWNGSAWLGGDIIFGATGTLNATSISIAPDQTIVVGAESQGTATASGSSSVIVGGNAETYPQIEFVGPGTLYQLVNETTKRGIFFNLTLLAGERAVLNLQPDAISFTSSFRGDISHTILPGSEESSWMLQPGTNAINVFMTDTDANSAALMTWHDAYSNVQAATP